SGRSDGRAESGAVRCRQTRPTSARTPLATWPFLYPGAGGEKACPPAGVGVNCGRCTTTGTRRCHLDHRQAARLTTFFAPRRGPWPGFDVCCLGGADGRPRLAARALPRLPAPAGPAALAGRPAAQTRRLRRGPGRAAAGPPPLGGAAPVLRPAGGTAGGGATFPQRAGRA